MFLFLSLWITALVIGYGIILLIKNNQGKRQDKYLNEISKEEFEIKLKDQKMKFIWKSGEKEYFSFISNCNFYLTKKYFIITPIQNFPFKVYHKPLIFSNNLNKIPENLHYLKKHEPDKIFFNSVLKDVLEINYHENHNKYRIRIKNLNSLEKQKIGAIVNCS